MSLNTTLKRGVYIAFNLHNAFRGLLVFNRVLANTPATHLGQKLVAVVLLAAGIAVRRGGELSGMCDRSTRWLLKSRGTCFG